MMNILIKKAVSMLDARPGYTSLFEKDTYI
jgi:hypothetical protein